MYSCYRLLPTAVHLKGFPGGRVGGWGNAACFLKEMDPDQFIMYVHNSRDCEHIHMLFQFWYTYVCVCTQYFSSIPIVRISRVIRSIQLKGLRGITHPTSHWGNRGSEIKVATRPCGKQSTAILSLPNDFGFPLRTSVSHVHMNASRLDPHP